MLTRHAETCPIEQIIYREGIWLDATTAIDIFSDVLSERALCLISIPLTITVITIPAAIIWNVKVPMKAKLGLALALCLSAFMIVVASIRISLGYLSNGGADTVWTYFCFLIEDAIAVFMVSTTAFRSTFGYYAKHNTRGSVSSRNRKNISIRMVEMSPEQSPERSRSFLETE